MKGQVRSNPPPPVPCQAISDAVRDAVSDTHTGPNVPPNACNLKFGNLSFPFPLNFPSYTKPPALLKFLINDVNVMNIGQVPSNAPPPKPHPAISGADSDKPIELDVPPITGNVK